MTVSTPDLPPVLTEAGRDQLLQRRGERLRQLAELAGRISSGERTPDDVGEYQRLLEQAEEITAVLANSTDVASVPEDPTIVELGDEVDIETEDGERDTYALVHQVEASSAQGRISIASPLGRALLGARSGDRVRVEAPGGAYFCTVLDRRRLT